jgi:hypothetical protein
MNINYIKKLSGVPEGHHVIKEIVDEKILSKPYAMRIAEYILDTEGHKWWSLQGIMAATEILYKDDDVRFWIDGQQYEGFLADHPVLKATFQHGQASLLFNVEILFLRDEV